MEYFSKANGVSKPHQLLASAAPNWGGKNIVRGRGERNNDKNGKLVVRKLKCSLLLLLFNYEGDQYNFQNLKKGFVVRINLRRSHYYLL